MADQKNSEVKKRRGNSKSSPTAPASGTSVSPKKSSKKGKAVVPAQNEEEIQKAPIYGKMPTFPGQRLWSRSALIIGLMVIVYFSSGKTKESSFGKFGENIPGKAFETKCSPAFEEAVKGFKGCAPAKCGRLLTDNLVSPEEIYGLVDIGKRGLGPAKDFSAIYDLTTATLHFNEQRIDLIKLNSTKQPIFRTGDLQYFQATESKVRRMISEHFGIDYWSLHLTAPIFYTQMTTKGSRRDEMSLPIVHQTLYKGLHYTALISLSDHGSDFQGGGRLVFPDGDYTNRTVEAQRGRVLTFTSGLENRHYTEPITAGSRITLHLGFTCDPKGAVKKPKLT